MLKSEEIYKMNNLKKIKKGYYAVYEGKEYSSAFPKKDGTIIIRSYKKEDLEHGFIDISDTNIFEKCYKYVPTKNITELYDITTTAIYEGVEFGIRQEKEGMLYITTGSTTGMGAIIEKYNMVQFDRGEYGMWVSIEDVELKVRKKNVVIK